MIQFLYTLFIFPIEQVIELAFVFFYRIFHNPALSVLGVSFAVSILTLPLYFIAEKHQLSERIIQKKMKPETDTIRSVFSGDERYMRLAVYYRQNSYHPLYSIRSSISILIQIPFFIAAFHFISNLDMIRGVSFGPISDLSKPDSLLTVNSLTINILPVIMTLINSASALVYTKGLPSRDKVQLYGMALVFLVLLYGSPSGLVFYWAGNNLFSLIKNIVNKTKYPNHVILALTSFFTVLLSIFILFIHQGALVKRISLVLILIIIPVGMFYFFFLFPKIKQKLYSEKIKQNNTTHTGIFLLSIIIMFLLAGLVIPSMLIESSVHEFSFVFILK